MPGEPPRQGPGRGSTRPGAGRGPRTVGPRSTRHVPADEAKDSAATTAPPDSPKAHAEARSRVISTLAMGVTHRIIALVVTVAVLVISFVSSFSVYLGQQRDIAQTKSDIANSQANINHIQDELNRWQDPAYVKAQARTQLGWVMPGEVGYRVIDSNGQVIGGTVPLATDNQPTQAAPWYDTLWSSVQTADQPAPASNVPSAPPTIGPDTPPTSIPTTEPGSVPTSSPTPR